MLRSHITLLVITSFKKIKKTSKDKGCVIYLCIIVTNLFLSLLLHLRRSSPHQILKLTRLVFSKTYDSKMEGGIDNFRNQTKSQRNSTTALKFGMAVALKSFTVEL